MTDQVYADKQQHIINNFIDHPSVDDFRTRHPAILSHLPTNRAQSPCSVNNDTSYNPVLNCNKHQIHREIVQDALSCLLMCVQYISWFRQVNIHAQTDYYTTTYDCFIICIETLVRLIGKRRNNGLCRKQQYYEPSMKNPGKWRRRRRRKDSPKNISISIFIPNELHI